MTQLNECDILCLIETIYTVRYVHLYTNCVLTGSLHPFAISGIFVSQK